MLTEFLLTRPPSVYGFIGSNPETMLSYARFARFGKVQGWERRSDKEQQSVRFLPLMEDLGLEK